MSETVRSTIQKRDAKGVIRHGGEWLALWSDPNSMKSAAELKREAGERKAALDVEHRLAAAARALSGDPAMQIAFAIAGDKAGRNAFEALPAAATDDPQELAALRGDIDSHALIQRHHDAALHAANAPEAGPLAALYAMCEEVRCEALGARQFPGVAANIAASHRRRLERNDLINAHLASLIPLAEGLRMVLRDTLTGAAEPSIASSGFWMWDQWLRARFSSHLLALAAHVDDQAGFGALARRLIEDLVAELGSAEGKARRFEPSARQDGGQQEGEGNQRLTEDETGSVFEPGGALLLDEAANALSRLLTQEAAPKPLPYKPFTTAHDLVLHASELADSATLRKERATLEKRRAEFRRDFAKLVTRLQRKLLARQTRSWSFDLDEGLVDASRLDRVVVNPGFASAYKQEQESEFRDTVVSILIDNSGSMRGKPIEIACVVSDLISSALERASVRCEVLGFTTRGWKGGEAAKDWARAGRPANPGRLNDTLHIIYKSADEPVRNARLSLCAMLDSGLLKENIDGEALLWASRRLYQRSEARKVLIVVSDGAPVDQATIENNDDKAILDRHLREVVGQIEASGGIELAAIGVKHDVSTYFRNSVQIDKVENLGESLLRMIDLHLTR
ncbi:MAG: hypothetical protein AB7S80_15655 [Rhizobiaceae bacterium]